jgi:hypothetical protein
MSFRLKLFGSLILVILVAILAVYLIAHRSTAEQFRLYVIRGEALRLEALKSALIDYYREHGGWEGVREFLAQGPLPGGLVQALRPRLILLGPDERVLVAPDPRLLGQRLPKGLAQEGLPLNVEGRRVGALLSGPVVSQVLEPIERGFLSSVNRSLLLGGLVALAAALALGAVLLRQLTTPLRS